jgi:hypothetical protein
LEWVADATDARDGARSNAARRQAAALDLKDRS